MREDSTITEFPGSAGGSLASLRAYNEQLVLDTLSEIGASSQAAISRSTGLSKATISSIVQRLSEDGVVTITQGISSGRRAHLIDTIKRKELMVGIEFAAAFTEWVIVSSSGTIVAGERVPLGDDVSWKERATVVRESLPELLEHDEHLVSQIDKVGVSVAAPIFIESNTIAATRLQPGWGGLDIVHALEQEFNKPITIINDATAGALAECTWGPHRNVANLVYIYIAGGVGAGLVVDGKIYHGGKGLSGEIGHLPAGGDTVCRCGNRGCLETLSSIPAILAQARQTGAAIDTFDDLVSLVRDKNFVAQRIIESAGREIGQSAAHIAHILNPDVIVIGGQVSQVDTVLIPAVIAGFTEKAMPEMVPTTIITGGSHGSQTIALGAAASTVH